MEGFACGLWDWYDNRSYGWYDNNDPAFDGSNFLWDFIAAPLSFTYIFKYFSSSRWIRENYESHLNSVVVPDELFKEEFSE
ncbi:MAG: hypothetical protein SVY15_08430 [Halobacteriota archaeon]|nr:hypothetical protein [Halobacteriota archaeon]